MVTLHLKRKETCDARKRLPCPSFARSACRAGFDTRRPGARNRPGPVHHPASRAVVPAQYQNTAYPEQLFQENGEGAEPFGTRLDARQRAADSCITTFSKPVAVLASSRSAYAIVTQNSPSRAIYSYTGH